MELPQLGNPPAPLPTKEDAFEKALERLRHNPDFRTVIADLRAQREEKFTQLGAFPDQSARDQTIGEITILTDMANTFEGT